MSMEIEYDMSLLNRAYSNHAYSNRSVTLPRCLFLNFSYRYDTQAQHIIHSLLPRLHFLYFLVASSIYSSLQRRMRNPRSFLKKGSQFGNTSLLMPYHFAVFLRQYFKRIFRQNICKKYSDFDFVTSILNFSGKICGGLGGAQW